MRKDLVVSLTEFFWPFTNLLNRTAYRRYGMAIIIIPLF